MRVDLRKTLFILPNLFTLSSIFCGFYAMLVCTSPSVPLPVRFCVQAPYPSE